MPFSQEMSPLRMLRTPEGSATCGVETSSCIIQNNHKPFLSKRQPGSNKYDHFDIPDAH
jgi:hypothetical protein